MAKKKKVKIQPPAVLALVLADIILSEPASGKFYINGTFSAIVSNAFPCTHPRMAVYLAITNGHGPTPINIRLIDVDEDRPPLATVEFTLNFPDPIVVVEAVGVLQNLVFPIPGDYRLELFAAGTPIMSRRLAVVQPPGQQPPPKAK